MTSPVLIRTTSELDSLARRSLDDVRALSDDELLALTRTDAQILRVAQTRAALAAGEVARRSEASLGGDGLAKRTGFRTPVELVKATTGSTTRDATSSVRVGTLATESHPVSRALLAGDISVAAADAIRTGLGAPTADISETTLADAAVTLCDDAASLDPDRLLRKARQVRDEIDATGVADREAARRAARSLRLSTLPDGMTRLTWLMDTETAAIVRDVYDRATSPRRGGPRFVDSERAASIAEDDRSTEQLASDVFTELLRHSADTDSTLLLGSGAPVVNVIVTREALDTGRGAAWIEGQTESVSVATVERLVCSGSVQQVTVDDHGQVLNLGREQRLYNRHQRRALAVRDGGCRWPGCDRPPSWTEAHHIAHWAQHGGATDVSNGILLCRHHHLLLHNYEWEIESGGGEFRLVPPASIDPARQPRPMPPKGPWTTTTRNGTPAPPSPVFA
jgi:hypothetical protein